MLPYLIAGAIGFGIGKLFENGGETFMTGGQVKEEWKSYLKESRVDALVKAGYSKNVAKNLSSESWDSLEKQVQNAFKNVLISEEVQYMKGMMESIYTYGRLNKDNNYLAKYKVSLGNKLFNKTFDEYKKELEEGYDVDYGTYTDSEGLTYSSLRKKYVNGGETGVHSFQAGDKVIFNQDPSGRIGDNIYYGTILEINNGVAKIEHQNSNMKNVIRNVNIANLKKYADGGEAGMIHYYIGGLVSEDIPFVYKGEEEDINYEVGFHEGGIDLETFKETPSGYYVRIMPYGSTNIRRFVYPEKDIEIAYLSELRAITMLLFEADKDTKENQKIAIKEGKKNLPKLLKYMSENVEEEDEFRKNVRIVQDAMWGGDEDEDEDEYAGGGVAKKRRRSASIQYGRSDTAVDKTRDGKPVGYRFSNAKANQLRKDPYDKPTEAQVKKYLGKGIYKENRKNRSDKDRNAKL